MVMANFTGSEKPKNTSSNGASTRAVSPATKKTTLMAGPSHWHRVPMTP